MPREVAGHLAVARRDIKASQGIAGIDLDWAFVAAYNSIMQTSVAYMNYRGFRTRGGEGNHYWTFRFMEEALPEQAAMIKRIQKLRKKRNISLYDDTGLVGEKEAHEVIEFAERYHREIARKLPAEIRRLGDEEESS
jgi:hypothetical protein